MIRTFWIAFGVGAVLVALLLLLLAGRPSKPPGGRHEIPPARPALVVVGNDYGQRVA